ncbi:MAG: alpha/beta hydrolase [Bryobacteraceae bacterium]
MAASLFTSVYLLHGKGGWPGGSVLQLEDLLRTAFPDLVYVRPSLPHGREKGIQAAERSLEFLQELPIEAGALLVGISLGGLVAAGLQETGREDLTVICISSPTSADGLELTRRPPRRLSLYSSTDEVIAGRTSRWPELAEAHDLPWLSHDTDAHKEALARVIVAYMSGLDINGELAGVGAEYPPAISDQTQMSDPGQSDPHIKGLQTRADKIYRALCWELGSEEKVLTRYPELNRDDLAAVEALIHERIRARTHDDITGRPILSKAQLTHGRYYKGRCRNATIARWNAAEQLFYHWRKKFDRIYIRTVKYPTDEDEPWWDIFFVVEELPGSKFEIPFDDEAVFPGDPAELYEFQAEMWSGLDLHAQYLSRIEDDSDAKDSE